MLDGGGFAEPTWTLLRANQILLEDSRSGMFVTVFYGVLDLDTGHFTYARAGHNPPLLVRAADGSVVELDPPGVVLGVLEDVELVEESLQLGPGDALVMFTDGVTEAINEEGRQFGEERLKELLVDTSGHGAGDLVDLIDAAVQAFAGECPQFDDFTLVVLKREKAPLVGW